MGCQPMGYFRCNSGVYFNKDRQVTQSFKIAESFNKLVTTDWIRTAVSQTTHIPDVLVSNADRNPTTFIEVRRGFPQHLKPRFYFYYVGGTLQHILFHKAFIVEKFDTRERAYTHKHTYVPT